MGFHSSEAISRRWWSQQQLIAWPTPPSEQSGEKIFSSKSNFPDMGELTSRGLTVMEQEEERYIHIQEKNFITYNLSLAWDNDSNFKSSAPRQHLVFKFPHHNFQHIRGKFLHLCSKYQPDKEINLKQNVLSQEGRVDPKSDGYVAGYKNKKGADAKMRPS